MTAMSVMTATFRTRIEDRARQARRTKHERMFEALSRPVFPSMPEGDAGEPIHVSPGA